MKYLELENGRIFNFNSLINPENIVQADLWKNSQTIFFK